MLSRADWFDLVDARAAQCGIGGGHVGVLLLRVQRLGEVNLVLPIRLIEAALQRIGEALRPVDRCTRIGDCDFAIVLPDMRGLSQAALAANRLVRAFQEPLAVAGRPVQTLVAIGAAVGPEHGLDAEQLCRNAEIAFAKAQGNSDRYAVFAPHEALPELSYGELRDAIINNRLAVHLQPFWDLRHDRVVGAESLARWDSGVQGRVSPEQFVPYAEQTGLIPQLTRWSLNTSLRYCGQARQCGRDFPFAVNLSARVFHEQGIVEQIVGAVEIWNVPPDLVVLEVTENALMADPQLSARVLERLRDHGFRIAIDDFGSGYSSFAYLKQFPATELKIDKSFVTDMTRDARAAQLVRSMIDLAHHLEIEAIAEGVEDAATALMLVEMECDYAQGYFYGRPQPAEEFIARHCAPPVRPDLAAPG